ncbi:MAG: T9SS type A sorting domain-containing protein [Fluviicola sp.]
MKAIWTKIVFLSVLLIGTSARAQLTVSNPETLVNSTTASTQQSPAVAMDTAGRYVVAWESELEDGSGFGVYAKIYNADHSVRVSDFLVNTVNTTNDQRNADVAITPDGGSIAIVWQSNHSGSQNWDCMIRFYDINGVAQTSEMNIESSTSSQMYPEVAASDDMFAVVFMNNLSGGTEYAISGRQYNATGTAIGAAYTIDSVGQHLSHPTVAMDSSGNVIYAWQHYSVTGDPVTEIRARNYDNTGSATSSVYYLAIESNQNLTNPSLARASTGEFIVAFSYFDQDGDHYGIYGQRFNNSGGAVGGVFKISNSSNGSQDHPQINCTRDGAYYSVTWTDESNDGDQQGVYSRVFNYGLTYLNSEQLVNSTTDDRQMLSDVALGIDTGQVVYVWQGGLRKSTTTGLDTDEYGVYSSALEIADLEAPNAVCQNITVYLDGTGSTTITATDVDGGSTDNLGITSYSVNQTSFTCANTGSNVVTLTVEDAAGNSDQCLAVVTVVDSMAPTAVCQNLTVYLDGAGNATITAGDVDAGSTDNCSLSSLSVTPSVFTCADVGVNNVTLTASDASGNIGSCNATVTVIDSVTPTAVCQDITVYLDATGNATITGADLDAGSSDNCTGTLTFTPSVSSFDCTNIGANAVSLTVTDLGGNSAACSATVTVIDSVTPTAVCQDITVYLDATGNASITAADVDGGSTDNCGAPSLGIDVSAFTCANVGANTVTLTATDGSGNVGSCTATVTVIDSATPTAVCQNITAYLDGAGNVAITAADIDGGSTDNCGTPTLSASQTSFTCADVGANNVTLTVTDGSGNSSSCTAVVTIADTTSPTAFCQDVTVYLDGTGNATITSGDLDGGSADNCGIASLSISQASFTCADVGANTVTLTVTDASGNTDACTSTVTVVDSVTPTAVCQDITVYLDATGNASITAADVDGGSTDNCGAPSLGVDVSAFTCANVGANTITLTATDGSGNVGSCTATVTVIDSVTPTAVCQNITAYLDGAGNVAITAADIDGGSTDNCGTPTLAASQTSFTCADVGANNVTLTVTDGSGNSSSCTAVVTIADTTSPIAFCQDVTVYLDGTGNATITSGDLDGGSADNCGIASLSISQASFTCADVGANTVTLTVTDASGNTDACTSTVTVVDSVTPTAVCQDITVYLDATGNASITAADVDGGSTDNCGAPSLGVDVSAFTCANVGANTITLTATDGSGNVGSCTATVTVIDSATPTAVCQNITAYLDGAGNVAITAADIDGGSTDNCGTPTLSASQTSFTCADVGANNVTLTVTDGSGNSSSCTAVVTIADTTSPTAFCQDVTVYLDGTGNATITSGDLDGGSADNCGIASLSISQASFTCADVGANTVTLTVTDASGNTDACTSTVTVVDSVTPTAVCQDITVYLDATGNASITAADVDGGSTDNCGAPSLGVDVSAFTCANVGANTITLTATDGSGNVGSCTATVTVIDSVTPTAVCQNITAYLDGAGNVAITAADIDGGSTDNCGTPTLAASQTSFTCADVGANNVTLTVTDGSGNSSSCTAVVTIADTTSPIAFCQDVTVYLDGTGNATITSGDLDGGSADNCGIASLSISQASFTCADVGANTVTLTVTDASGNTDACTSTVTVVDSVTPTAVCQDITVYLDATGNASITAADVDGGSTDNCGAPSLGVDVSAFTCANVGANTITLTATDGSGNVGSCTATVTVIDSVTPTAVCQNITAYLDGAGNVAITAADIDGGSTDNCGTPTLAASQTSFTCADVGANNVTLTVTDGSGNSSSCTAVVTIADTTSPTAFCQDVTVYLDGTGNATITSGDLDGGSADNCGIASLSISQASFTCADVGANTVTLTVTDASGNTDACTSTVTVVDSVTPTAVCQDITVYLDATGNASITAADVDGGSTDNCGAPSLGVDVSAFTCANVGANTITLTATDGSGNVGSCTATVTVIDSATPTAVCQNITAYLDGAGNVAITAADIDGGSTDNCGTPTLSASQTSFTCADVGANNVTLTVTDGSGNSSSCTAVVTIADTTSPTAFCQDVTVYLDGTGNATITSGDLDGGSADNCGIASLSISQASFTCADVGANTVTLTVTDASGNTDACTSTVTVVDSVTPTAVCQDITVYLDATGNASITAADVDGGSTDNCGAPSLGVDVSAFTCANVGANTITLTATDGSGNVGSCTATVTVIDSVTPTAVCQNITAYLDGAGNVAITAADIDGGSTDNCGTPTLAASQTSFTCADVGANNVTLTVTDGSGNSSSCTAVVTIADTTSPIAFCQDVTVYLDGTGNATITSGDLDGGSADNCGIASLSISQASFTCADVGANTVTLTVTDASGNTDACTSTVTVVDSVTPTAVCQDITVYLDATGNASITAADVDGGSTDNCGAPSLGVDVSAFTCANVGANTITLTATDGSGNVGSCTATVTVIDSVTPTAVCQNITAYLDGAGNVAITAADIDGGSTDNCGTPTLAASQTSFTCADVGANNVTLTVTDGSGNSSSCTAVVTIADTTSPTAFCQDVTVYLDGTGNATITSGDLDGGSADNCGIASLSISQASFTCADVGANTVTLTVTDASGNTDECTSTVTVVDSVTPTAVCQDITVYLDATGNASITAADVDGGSTDNCGAPSLGVDVSAFTCANVGANTVTLTATDGSGNVSTCTAVVTIADTTSPVLPTLSDIVAECSVTVTAPTTTDNCSGTVTGTTSDPLTYSTEGTYVITWTFDDGNGNITTATQNVILDDVTAPVVPTLADLTDECSVTATAPTTTDNCAGTVTGTTADPLTYNTQGTFVITWTFDDGNGNTSTATQNVIINDVTLPTATNIDTAYAECIGDVPVDITLVDDEADNCGVPTVTYVGDVASNGTGCGDTITRTYNVSDDAGNNINVTQIIVLNDVTPPTASNPITLNVVCLADVPSSTGATSWVTDEADNCGTPTVTWVSDVSSNGTGCNDTITRTFSVTDDCGNAITLEQLIIIDDHVAPEPDAVSLEEIKETCEATPTAPTATDNCAGVINGVPDVSFPITTVGTTIVTWTFTDNCGNTSTQTQEVTITGVDVSTTMASDGITMIALNQNAGVTYQWIDCETGLPVTGATNYNFTPTYGSDFAVVVTEDGCTDTSACVNSTVSLEQIALEGFVLYPNPTTGQFTVSFDGVIKSIEMIDVTGRVVLTETTLNEGLVDASLLAPGKYMVRLTSEHGTILTQPIVIGQQ